MATFLAERATFIGYGKTNGRLFDFGAFPGMLPAEKNDDWVIGEVWRLHEVRSTLAELDRYEGCVPDEPQPWIFRRDQTTIVMDNADRLVAWIYWYCGEMSQGRYVATGDYLTQNMR